MGEVSCQTSSLREARSLLTRLIKESATANATKAWALATTRLIQVCSEFRLEDEVQQLRMEASPGR